MTRKVLAATIVTAAALALAGSSFARSSATTLVGVVGPGYTISLKMNGAAVKSLTARRYTFVIHDKSSSHNYVLSGPNGFKQRFTTVRFVGTKTFTVRLGPGRYKVYCAPHASFMFKRFTVTG